MTPPEIAAAPHDPQQPRPVVPAEGAVPDHRLSLVVPLLDELENVAPLLDAIEAALETYGWPWELLVVDDGSRDGTGAALERQGERRGPHVRVLHLRRNLGQAAALQAGIDAARGDVIVTMDGDLQNDPRDVPRLVARLLREDLDLVAGWRQRRQDGLLLRRLPSAVANRLVRRTTGLAFRDLGCTLKAFRAPVLRAIRLQGEMHRFIPAWLATVTAPERMAEEPVAHHPRARGRSKYGLSRTFRVLPDLLAVFFFMRFRARPGHFFGALGLGVLAVGLGLLAYLGVEKLSGEAVGQRPLLALAFSCVLGGVQLLTTGVLAELVIRPSDRIGPRAGPVAFERRRASRLLGGWHPPAGAGRRGGAA